MIDVINSEATENTIQAQKKLNETDVKIDKIDKKKELTPYQKFLLGGDLSYKRYKQKYFDFYDDVKDKTHNVYDW